MMKHTKNICMKKSLDEGGHSKMSPKRAKRANELPFIPLGPFQWRIPGIHYRVEYVEFFQGLILGATALSSIPYLTYNL